MYEKKAIEYFMQLEEWFSKADLDFLVHLYRQEKNLSETGFKHGSAFLAFLKDYLEKKGIKLQ